MLFKIILLFFTSLLFASQPVLRFSNLSTKDGLPNNVMKHLVQDNKGFIWIASQNGLSRYDGNNIEVIKTKGFDMFNINTLFVDTDDNLWVGTKTQGLFIYEYGRFNSIKLNIAGNNELNIKKIVMTSPKNLWIASSSGLYKVDRNTFAVEKIDFFKNKFILSIDTDENNNLLVATFYKVYLFNFNNYEIKELPINYLTRSAINTLYKDKRNHIWLGTRKGLYQYKDSCQCFESYNHSLEKLNIYTLTSDKDNLWIGTLEDGLFLYHYKSSLISHYTNNPVVIDNYQLSDNNIVSLLIDKSHVLWVGTFHSGLDYINLSFLDFNLSSFRDKGLYCAQSFIIYDIFEESSSVQWIASSNGLIRVDRENESCELFKSNENNPKSLVSNIIRSVFIDSHNNYWIGTSLGLNLFNSNTHEVNRLRSKQKVKSISFIIEFDENKLLLGGANGLSIYNISENEFTKVKFENSLHKKLRFNNYSTNLKGEYIFATNKGIFKLNKDLELHEVPILFEGKSEYFITSLYADSHGGIWFGANFKYLLYLNNNGKVENKTSGLLVEAIEIQSIIPNENHLWISSNKGIFSFNVMTNQSMHYSYLDGLQDDNYFFTSNYKAPSGKIYFGGNKGFNSFLPNSVLDNANIPNIAISNIFLQGEKLRTGDYLSSEQIIETKISDLKKLRLTYKDKKIDFEFSVLDFSDPKQNKYSYRLKGYSEEWEQFNTKNKHATFTNLDSGNYLLQVKGKNKYNILSKNTIELKIIIKPAPWYSAWAYLIYALLIILSLWCYIRYKTIVSRKRAEKLEKIIVVRTQEVNMQKKMVESLLEHKNEIFANITHEFKTPLTLILGPCEQLVSNPELIKYSEEHSMIQRNAERLMLMVGQILKLSEAENDKEFIRVSQGVRPTLLMLYESFKPLAQGKKIELILENNHDVNIYATSECLEIVVGNLISNALKFTNSGGKVIVRSEIQDSLVKISVKDNGSGIREKDRDKIFKRFTRLDAHKNIAGTGIGLSVVKEITIANDGQVNVQSTWGKGTTFTITYPTTRDKVDEGISQILVGQLIANTQNELTEEQTTPVITSKKNLITVLIIEDNLDMQNHIGKVLSQRFNCFFADRGKYGIALALKELPDIIICDIMMPGMDGYQVARILRHDGRTSHIPIVLLTALNTIESRIKGWRENIDTYISKPFNDKELNIQLDNILTIRTILQKRTNVAFKRNKPFSNLELSKQDIKFIDKLRDVIGMVYANEHIQRADLADKMAASESQLQRKVIALIGERPMTMLRDYRLEKAAMKLKDGYQVSIVSDDCGFSSVSYFGSCFKKRYGVSPKQYQQLNYKS